MENEPIQSTKYWNDDSLHIRNIISHLHNRMFKENNTTKCSLWGTWLSGHQLQVSNPNVIGQTPLWSLDVMFCALRQGTLSTLSQSTHLKLGTSICWGLTFDRLVSHPGPGESMTLIRFAPRKSGISTGLMCLHGSEKDLTLKSSLYLLVK